MSRLTCVGALALLLLTVSPATAKEAASRVTIGGADLADQIVVTAPAALEALALLDAGADAVAWPSDRAPALTAGYELVRSWGDPPAAADRLRYVPDPSGGRGYVWRAADGKWFPASVEGDAALRRILAAPRAPPAAPAAAAAPSPGPTAGAVAVCVWLFCRRRGARAGASRGDA